MIEEINKRNTLIVEQALKEIKTEILNQHIRIDGLNAVMSTMSERMNFLEKLVIEHKVKTLGTGPTVK